MLAGDSPHPVRLDRENNWLPHVKQTTGLLGDGDVLSSTDDILNRRTEELARLGFMEQAERRNILLRAQAEAWKAKPPAAPVLAAGSTGSIPATADLLDVIAHLPLGAVVLPGLDLDLDDESWNMLGEPGTASHPQYGMKKLLTRLRAGRADVPRRRHRRTETARLGAD